MSKYARDLLCYLDAVERGDERAVLLYRLPAIIEAARGFRAAMEQIHTASAITLEQTGRLREAIERMSAERPCPVTLSQQAGVTVRNSTT